MSDHPMPPATMNVGGMEIEYDERVLSPRPWTAAQAEWMADLLHPCPPGPVLELCSGVGHIGLLAGARTGRDLVLVDASPAACGFAERNSARNPVAGAVEIRQAPMEEALLPDERFVGILADPPWVPSARVSVFPEDPVTAIDGGEDGLDLARLCLRLIDRHLAGPGVAVLQVGNVEQAAALAEDLPQGGGPGLRVVETRSFGDRGCLVALARA